MGVDSVIAEMFSSVSTLSYDERMLHFRMHNVKGGMRTPNNAFFIYYCCCGCAVLAPLMYAPLKAIVR